MLTVMLTSPEQTMEVGSLLGRLVQAGDVLNLNGDLGAGKTIFVKGVGMGLGLAADSITSPTFAIINEYQGRYPLYHFDLYRLDDALELEQIGYEDYFYGQGVSAVEWGNLFESQLPEERLDIGLETVDATKRRLTILGLGARGKELEDQLRGQIECMY